MLHITYINIRMEAIVLLSSIYESMELAASDEMGITKHELISA